MLLRLVVEKVSQCARLGAPFEWSVQTKVSTGTLCRLWTFGNVLWGAQSEGERSAAPKPHLFTFPLPKARRYTALG